VLKEAGTMVYVQAQPPGTGPYQEVRYGTGPPGGSAGAALEALPGRRRRPAARAWSTPTTTERWTVRMAEAAKRDYYEVLGLARDADAKAIRDAFRQLALKYHPDRNKEPGAEERFKEIAEAYAVLSDPKKRADYDARGFGGLGDMRPEDLFGGIDFEDLFGGLGFDLGGGLFERFFGGGRHHQRQVRGDNLELPLQIPLERVLAGGEETLRFERFRPPALEQQGVGDHADRTQGHGRAGHHRVQVAQRRQRYAGHVVGKGPEQVLADLAHGAPERCPAPPPPGGGRRASG
jgi:hypothetical protein